MHKKNVDVDISEVIYGEQTLDEAAEQIAEYMVRVCSGEYTSAEILFHEEFAPSRLFPQS